LEVGPVPGELTRTDAVLLLVDQQEGPFSRIHDAEATRRILVALARCARLLEVPAVMTTALAGGPNGAQLPELADAFPDQEVIDRTVINAWHDARVREAIRGTGRRQVVIAGTGLDVCAQLPALAASAEGFEAYAAIDSCGRFDPAALDRHREPAGAGPRGAGEHEGRSA
jgi:nicotinamidase-related amidase